MNVKDFLDRQFRIIILENKINIVNFIDIDAFNDNNIIVKYVDGIVSIRGDYLIISKLLDNEVLIKGFIKQIEFR